MNELPRSKNFWLGNAVLALALLFLLELDTISAVIGFNAMIIWIGLVVAGAWLLMTDKSSPPPDA